MALLIVVAEHALKANIESRISVRDIVHTILFIGSQSDLTFNSKLPSQAAAPSSHAAMSS